MPNQKESEPLFQIRNDYLESVQAEQADLINSSHFLSLFFEVWEINRNETYPKITALMNKEVRFPLFEEQDISQIANLLNPNKQYSYRKFEQVLICHKLLREVEGATNTENNFESPSFQKLVAMCSDNSRPSSEKKMLKFFMTQLDSKFRLDFYLDKVSDYDKFPKILSTGPYSVDIIEIINTSNDPTLNITEIEIQILKAARDRNTYTKIVDMIENYHYEIINELNMNLKDSQRIFSKISENDLGTYFEAIGVPPKKRRELEEN